MKGFPPELLLLVLLGIAALLNFVMQRAARQRQAEAAQEEPAQDEIPEHVWRVQPVADLSPAATHDPAPRPAKVRSASPAPPRHRFSRQALFGSRRKVQDAFVVATILGRCRGDEPHEVGQSPGRAGGRTAGHSSGRTA